MAAAVSGPDTDGEGRCCGQARGTGGDQLQDAEAAGSER